MTDSAGGERPQAGAGWRDELSDAGGPAAAARAVHGDVYFGDGSPSRVPVPGQLPPAPANFTGRAAELAGLQRLITGREPPRPVTLAVLAGGGGAGKTSVAVRWLRQVRGRYPGGQLFADLGGSSEAGPVSPGEVLAGFVRALGTPPQRVPAGLNELGALFRSLTDGRRMIVLLDDAATEAQVRALLPGPGPSLVVVTARQRLTGLAIDGAWFAELGPMGEPDALLLLERIAGAGRIRAEPVAAAAVARLCGHLPLALCVAGALPALSPRWSIERMAGELAGQGRRLAALSIKGDVSVRAAFDVSYQALPAPAARLYRLLALIPGPGFGPDLAAAATATGPAGTREILQKLAGASLLAETGHGRFGFHDLARLHAREQAQIEAPPGRRAVVASSVAWYLRRAVAADLVVIPGRWRLGPLYDQAAQEPQAHAGPAQALAWLESELPGLLAAVRAAHDEGLDEQAWQLCEALWGLFACRKHYEQWIAAHLLGIESAAACGDRRAQARLRVQLGLAHLELGRYGQARQEFARALALDRSDGFAIGEATALEQLGLTDLALRRPAAAIGQFAQAQAILSRLGRPRGVAMMVCHIGAAHRDAGQYEEAIASLAQARRLSAAIPDPYNEARALTSLGQTLIRAGRPGDGAAPLDEALGIMTGLGTRYEQARIHVALADSAAGLDDHAGERAHLGQALAIYGDLGAPEEAGVRGRLAGSGVIAGSPVTRKEDGSPAI